MLLRNLSELDKSTVYELGSTLFRDEDELPDLRLALTVCVLERSYVAVEDNVVVGFSVVCHAWATIRTHSFLEHMAHGYELAFLGVSRNVQGRGIGSMLLKETLRGIFQQERPICWLLVDTVHVAAQAMYLRYGFTVWSTTEPHMTRYPCLLMGCTNVQGLSPPSAPI